MSKLLILFMILVQIDLGAVEFVLFTQPKTGTHLLIPILTALTGKSHYWAPEYTKLGPPLDEEFELATRRPDAFFYTVDRKPWDREMMDKIWSINHKNGTFLHLHAPYSPAIESYLTEKKCITFFVKRDPRDQIVSLLNHYKFIRCNDPGAALLESDEEKLAYLIKKESRKHTLHYMNWLQSPLCSVLDFDKLMGAHGGLFTDHDALEEMRKVAFALELSCTDEYLMEVYRQHFGHGWSFFKGKSGIWREYFTDELKALAKTEIGDLLISLGFEKDYNW